MECITMRALQWDYEVQVAATSILSACSVHIESEWQFPISRSLPRASAIHYVRNTKGLVPPCFMRCFITVGLCRRPLIWIPTLLYSNRRRQVSSFRVQRPSAGLRKLLDTVHEQIRDEERENMAAQAEMSGVARSEVSW